MTSLKDCGPVVSRPVGRQSVYSLTRPELLDLFAVGEQLLAATGAQVALCPTYGVDRAAVRLPA